MLFFRPWCWVVGNHNWKGEYISKQVSDCRMYFSCSRCGKEGAILTVHDLDNVQNWQKISPNSPSEQGTCPRCGQRVYR